MGVEGSRFGVDENVVSNVVPLSDVSRWRVEKDWSVTDCFDEPLRVEEVTNVDVHPLRAVDAGRERVADVCNDDEFGVVPDHVRVDDTHGVARRGETDGSVDHRNAVARQLNLNEGGCCVDD